MTAPVAILGLGCALPKGRLSAAGFEDLATRLCTASPREAALIRTSVRRSSVEGRGIALDAGVDDCYPFYPDSGSGKNSPPTSQRMEAYEQLAPMLAAEAARAALHQSGIARDRITHLVTASCTGFSAPGVDLHLIRELGLPATTARIHVGFMGCHAAVNACRTARALALEDTAARVLMVTVELCTLHFQYGLDRDALLPNTLFADGAAALVLGATEPGPGSLALLGTASCVIPESTDAMTWRIADTGFRMTLDSRVPDLIAVHTGAFVKDTLQRHGLALSDIAGWAIHPGGPRVVESVLTALALPPEAGEVSRSILRAHGNMSSATILFVLREFLRRGIVGPIVALAFGPGLTAELAIFQANR